MLISLLGHTYLPCVLGPRSS